MSKDSVNVIAQLEKKIKTQDTLCQDLKSELLKISNTNSSLENMCKQQAQAIDQAKLQTVKLMDNELKLKDQIK